MKLDWRVNECRVLVAKVGEVTYYVAPGVINLWRPHKQYTAFDGKVATVWPVEGGMSLTNAIAWCERDVERPEGCPAQPPAADPAAPQTSGEMSGKTSSPLGSFDARVWAKEFMRCNNGLSGPFVSSHVRVDEETMVGWFANALMRGYDEHRWKMEREAADKRPEPPSVEDRLARLEARQEAEDRAGFVAQLPGLYDKVGKLSLEARPFPADRLRDMARRIAELEIWLGTKKYAPEDNFAGKTWTKLEQLTNRLDKLENHKLTFPPIRLLGMESELSQLSKRVDKLEAK